MWARWWRRSAGGVQRQSATHRPGNREDRRTGAGADRGVGPGPHGGVGEDQADLGLPHWAGVVPLRMAGHPEPDNGVTVPVPDHVRPERSP